MLLLAGALAACRERAARLPALATSRDGVSVSGLSSGAYMASQLHLAHSRQITGVALVAGGPWGCAESLASTGVARPLDAYLIIQQAVAGCMQHKLTHLGIPDLERLAARARALAAAGQIDDLQGLARARIYLFSGGRDRVVVRETVAAAGELYRRLGVAAEAIAFVTGVPAGHAFVTEKDGSACEATAEPYIAACGYDQAGAVLAHLLGPLAPPSTIAGGAYETFDQRAHVGDRDGHGLADVGLLYVPQSCRTEAGCRVHIVLHGCGQSRHTIGDAFTTTTGFARWADTNRLVLLFPQVKPSRVNPYGCWDWWGYTGTEYLAKTAVQIAALHGMVQRLAERADGKP
ncbi:MAG: poly(3-hydroxybutyrate) depolymerase [Hyphomicrobiaceae bacterium]